MHDLDLIDLHVHSGPDIVHRRFTIREAGEHYLAMNGWAVIKSHLGSTASSAYQARQEGLPISGSVVLNEFGGGVAPHAVEQAVLEHGADPPARLLVYFPTLPQGPTEASTRSFHPWLSRKSWDGVRVFDDAGNVLPQAMDTIKAVRDSGSVLATGHLERTDSLRLVDAALAADVDRIVLTHALHPISGFTYQDLIDLAEVDNVWVETTMLSLFLSRIDDQDAQALLRTHPRSVLSSDLGQPEQQLPNQAWGWARTWLSDSELFSQVAVHSPWSLLRI